VALIHGWLVELADDGGVHVMPHLDMIAHEFEDCVCGPEAQPVEEDSGSLGWLHVHHSLDGREACE
jgi:hypothetical protein